MSKSAQIALGKVGKKQACSRLRAVVGRLLLFQVLTRFFRLCLFFWLTQMAVNGVWCQENRFQNFLDIINQKLRARDDDTIKTLDEMIETDLLVSSSV